jgi:3-oxoacyl-[acyl-carrier protein] reductase
MAATRSSTRRERDVVEALIYLVSDRARFVTGETLRVSGGLMVQV